MWNFTFIFLDFQEKFSLVLLQIIYYKNVKKNAIFFKSFWYKVFVHWKLKLFNFLVDSVNHPIVQPAWLNNSGYYARMWRRKRLDGQAPCAKLPSLWKESCWRDKILPHNIYINFFQCYNLRIFYSVYALHVKITIRLILNYLCVLFPIHK